MGDRPDQDVPLFSTRMLEGEYTAWALVWSWDYGAGVTLDGVLVDNYGMVYISDTIAGGVYTRTYLNVGAVLAGYIYNIPRLLAQPEAFSMTRKYVLGEDTAIFQQMDIWRDGVNIASVNLFTDEGDNNFMAAKSMSPNGKFLAFLLNSATTFNNRYVLLYEGT